MAPSIFTHKRRIDLAATAHTPTTVASPRGNGVAPRALVLFASSMLCVAWLLPTGWASAAMTMRFDGAGSALLVRTGASTFALDGTAVVTGLGRSKFHEDGTFTAFEQWTATRTITAANGDTVTLSSVGGVVSESDISANIETRETITGGTGRFAGAHGETATTSQTVVSRQGVQTNTFRFTGTIAKNGGRHCEHLEDHRDHHDRVEHAEQSSVRTGERSPTGNASDHK